MSEENPQNSNGSDKSDQSDRSDGVIPPHGGYRKLKSFQVAELVYNGTAIFCDRFIDKRSRTHDQMVQAARSGRQNIAEGSMASATSKKTELKLTGVAKASLEELLLDFEDFLRQRRLPKWDKDSPEALAVRNKFRSDQSDSSDKSDFDPYGIAKISAEVAANTLLCLINQATYLLNPHIASRIRERCNMRFGGRAFCRQSFGASLRDLLKVNPSTRRKVNPEQAPVFRGASKPEGRKLHRNRCNFWVKRQMQKLEQDFLNEGGFTERLYQAWQQRRREKSDPSDGSD